MFQQILLYFLLVNDEIWGGILRTGRSRDLIHGDVSSWKVSLAANSLNEHKRDLLTALKTSSLSF